MITITVYPTKKSALHLVHPTHGVLREAGSIWPKDSFTCRRLGDGSITETQPAAAEPVEATEQH